MNDKQMDRVLELVGEVVERVRRGRRRPSREFVNGDFVRREQR